MKGDGKGGFSALSSLESGISIYGEQRGAAVADFDADGRVDLAVGQNGGQTRLYRNVKARPGIRIRLRGAPGNTAAIGAQLRLVSAGQSSPTREIQAGAGYLSQNSAIQVLHPPAANAHLVVRWPGGQESKVELPADSRELQIEYPAKLTKLR